MGGNAFEKAERIPAKRYKEIVEDIEWLLSNVAVHGRMFAIPHSVRDKQDYGDIDVLVASSKLDDVLRQMKQGFRVLEVIKNNSGYNLLISCYEQFIQVDLNKIPDEDMRFAFHYFSWNDLGNFVGRIAHRQGLKHGHDGLWYIVREDDHQLGEILLTKDYDQALCHLGFDVNGFHDGFDTFDDMFAWVESSKYFEPSAFPLEHRNHKARTRDSKRKVYRMFLDRLQFDGEYVPSNKQEHLARHIRKWPHLRVESLILRSDNEIRKACKEKLNGVIVRALTGVDGKELGELMTVVRKVLPEQRVFAMNPQSIELGIMLAFESWTAARKK